MYSGVEYGTDELPSLPETGPGPSTTNKMGKYFHINFEKYLQALKSLNTQINDKNSFQCVYCRII